MQLDRIDCGLIESLQRDGRMSNKDLAAAHGISPSTCLERVRRLRNRGAILGFRAVVDPEVMGIGVQAMIFARLSQHAHVSFDELRESLLAIPEVVSLYLVGGSHDFLVHVATKDVVHLRNLLAESFIARQDIAHMETALIFEYARAPAVPNYIDPTE